MRQRILCLAVLLVALGPAAVAQQSVRQVELEYQRGEVSIQGVTETQGYLPPGAGGSGDYVIRSMDSSNSTINSREFGFDLRVYSETNYNLNETSKQITIPRSNSTTRISVYGNGTLEDTVTVGTDTEPDNETSRDPGSPTQNADEPAEDGTRAPSANSSEPGEQDNSSLIQNIVSGILNALPL